MIFFCGNYDRRGFVRGARMREGERNCAPVFDGGMRMARSFIYLFIFRFRFRSYAIRLAHAVRGTAARVRDCPAVIRIEVIWSFITGTSRIARAADKSCSRSDDTMFVLALTNLVKLIGMLMLAGGTEGANKVQEYGIARDSLSLSFSFPSLSFDTRVSHSRGGRPKNVTG